MSSGQASRIIVGGRLNNRAENSHEPTRARGGGNPSGHPALRAGADAALYRAPVCGRSLGRGDRSPRPGSPVHAETCPHYLFLTVEDYERPGFEGAKYVMTPPLRGHDHQAHLWRGLKSDDLQVVSTDHCPFCFNEEPYGMKFSKQ